MAPAGPAEDEESPTRFGGVQQVMTVIACGARHSCCVGHMGQLFCWGWSLHGQCGQGRAVVSVPQPQVVQGGRKSLCALLLCAASYSAALCCAMIFCAVGMSQPVYAVLAVLLRIHQPGCGTTSAIALMTFLIVDTCAFG